MIVGVLLQSMTKTIIVINYGLNKDYISKNLCEKRKIKNNKCNGSCHLKLKLKQSDDTAQKEPSLLKDKTEPVLYCTILLLKLSANKQTNQITQACSDSFPEPALLSVFRPPQA